MDFLEDLLDFGGRKHRNGHQGGHDNYDDDHDRNYDNRKPINRGYDANGRVAGTMPCSKCNKIIVDTFNFCPHCGTPIPRIVKCSSCGAEIVSFSKFCSSCGAKSCQV
jgi:hypothetical protein